MNFEHTLYSLLLIAVLLSSCSPSSETATIDWPYYKADPASSSSSPLDQINVSNVANLELAWEYKSGDTILNTIECNPVIVGGETSYPFYLFEGEMPHPPKIAMEVYDAPPEEWPQAALEPFADVITDPAAWAQKCGSL